LILRQMTGSASSKLNEAFGAGGPTFYPTVEIVAALNEAQRLFCLLTLALEKTIAWTVPPATTFFRMLQLTGDVPVLGFVNVSGGVNVAWAAGPTFEVEAWAPGITIMLNGAPYVIADVADPNNLTITTPAPDGAASYGIPSTNPAPLLFPDWIVPLRLTGWTSGAKIRPARLDDLWSLDSGWPNRPGAPVRYASLGADLLALWRQPAMPIVISLTYARAPVPLTDDLQEPEIPREYHPQLVNYAISRLRQVEGAEELAKTLPLLAGFLDAAQKYGDLMRARNRGGQYDTGPFELGDYDRSQLLALRPDLVPKRRRSAS
jgi:hypothetical protein